MTNPLLPLALDVGGHRRRRPRLHLVLLLFLLLPVQSVYRPFTLESFGRGDSFISREEPFYTDSTSPCYRVGDSTARSWSRRLPSPSTACCRQTTKPTFEDCLYMSPSEASSEYKIPVVNRVLLISVLSGKQGKLDSKNFFKSSHHLAISESRFKFLDIERRRSLRCSTANVAATRPTSPSGCRSENPKEFSLVMPPSRRRKRTMSAAAVSDLGRT